MAFLDRVTTSAAEAAQAALEKRQRDLTQQGMPDPETILDIKGLYSDPFMILDQLGFRERQTGLSYAILDQMERTMPIWGALNQIRVLDMSNFAVPQVNDMEAGFKISMREAKAKPGRKDNVLIGALQEMIQNCGVTYGLNKDNFETYLKKIVRDSLKYDQKATEVRWNRKGKPCDFRALDGATIRLADVSEDEDDPKVPRYVQIYDEQVIAEFAPHELIWGVRNPRSTLSVNSYGYSEGEMAVDTITSLLFGAQYNKNFFTNGSVTKGLLNFKGFVPRDRLEEFRRQWYAQITGVVNAFRTPAFNVPEGMEYISLHSTNRDMEWAEWQNFNIKILCAICGSDPAELNFIYGNTGQSNSLSQPPAERRIKQSRDRALRPILRAIAGWLNRHIIWAINDNYCLTFTGLDIKDAGEVIDNEKKTVSYLKTVDEIRAEHDLKPLPDGKGEVILDATWMQHATMVDQAAQQEQMMAQQGGMPGSPDEGEGGAPEPAEGATEDEETGNPEAGTPGEQQPAPAPRKKSPWTEALGKSRDGQRKAKIVRYEIDLD